MLVVAFDIEIYKNYFSCVIRSTERNSRRDFIIFEDRDDRAQLMSFINKRPTFVGFNSFSFDVPILKALYMGYSVNELWRLAKKIIEENANPYEINRQYTGPEINGIDLKRVLSLDISLKQVGIMIQWPKLQELPYDPNDIITKEKAKILLEYNDNDTQITRELYLKSLDDIELRKNIVETRGIDVMNASESQIANLILNSEYSQATGLNFRDFNYLRTPRNSISVRQCIGKNVNFMSDTMREFYFNLEQMKINVDKNDFNPVLSYKGTEYQLGVGGLHSKDTGGYFETTKDSIIIDADVASFYPYIILNNNIKPEHLNSVFLDILQNVTEIRIQEKQLGNKLNAAALKIVINSIFGKLGSDTFWLYDPLAFYSVTINGQLYLLSLIDMFEENGIDVLSANTDGIICNVPKTKIDVYYKICSDWEKHTNFSLEFTQYKIYARKDVNNYIAQDTKGKVKTKGLVFDDITAPDKDFSRIASRKYNMPIVAKALREYFINKTNPDEFINNDRDIFNFLISHKPGKDFQVFYNGSQVQHTNRFYISNSGCLLQKMKSEGQDTQKILSVTTEPVTLLNDVWERDTSEYSDLNRDYYIDEVRKIINIVKPKFTKRSLF